MVVPKSSVRPQDYSRPFYDEGLPAPGTLVQAHTGSAAQEAVLDMHVHAGMEMGIVLEGSNEIHYGELVVGHRAGDVWLCAMWEPHGWRVMPPGVTDLRVFFRPEFVGEELSRSVSWLNLFAVPPARRPRVTTPELRQQVLAIGHALAREIRDQPVGWLEVVRSALVWLLIELIRNWRASADDAEQLGQGLHPTTLSRIMPALTLVHADPTHWVKTAEAAAACDLSVSRFHVIFRRVMGISFGRFCLRSRLAFSAHRLLTTDRPVDVVAAEAGFVDRSHLHRGFVKQYGCTPGQFRERARLTAGRNGRGGAHPRARTQVQNCARAATRRQ